MNGLLSAPTEHRSYGVKVPGQPHRPLQADAGSSVRGWMADAASTLLLFVLLREWLLPLSQIYGGRMIPSAAPLIAAVAAFLLLDLLRLPGAFAWILKAAIAVTWLGLLYYPAQFPLGGWLSAYGETLWSDLSSIWNGSWEAVSAPTRTLWLLASFALLAEAVQSLLLVKKRVLWLLAATVLYLLALDAWFAVEAEAALLRSTAAGLALAAANRIPRLRRQYAAEDGGSGWRAAWSAGSLLLIGASLLAGLAGASLGKPVSEALQLPEYRLAAEQFVTGRLAELAAWAPNRQGADRSRAAVAVAARTGYPPGDTALGGPVTPDNGVAFVARTDEPTYWRGETRDVYDGRGWSLSGSEAEARPLGGAGDGSSSGVTGQEASFANGAAPLPPGIPPEEAAAIGDALPEPPQGQRVITQEALFFDGAPGNLLFAGGQIIAVEELKAADGGALAVEQTAYHPLSDAVSADSPHPLLSYKIKVALPETRAERLSAAGSPDRRQVGEQYWQLPESLPQRVRDLAEQLTKDAANDYERAKRIETYLKTNFTYSLEGAPPPGPGDFVDSFLFGHRTGYCDYFSTSMVVLLRAAGVPARWAKGFAPGELRLVDAETVGSSIASGEAASSSTGQAGPRYEATVRNLHAHSWPEVYFPGYGWVPFEPTPGYDGAAGGAAGFPDGRNGAGSGLLVGEQEPAEWGMLEETGLEATSIGGESLQAGVSGEEGTQPGTGAEEDRQLQQHADENKLLSAVREGAKALSEWFSGGMEGVMRMLPGAKPGPLFVIIGLVLMLLLAALAMARWKERRRSRLAWSPTRRNGDRELMHSMDKIWMMLYRSLGKRPSNHTLREYIRSLQFANEQSAGLLTEWAKLYENARFGGPYANLPSREQLTRIRRQLQKAIEQKEIRTIR
ncbi:transglutaminase-like domain-containing protein [Paenibacillus sp. SAFN-117]|uniref:transglutaminase-like domain-containing protein n=1 Tax=Paenibacillus sp. SAFN-117 TaxID=3436860 RepID=UPI003F80F413